jgi:basic amino acid/polyamine antiporter, APA family
VVAAVAAIANINEIVELTNIGTLFAFVLVCLGVIILRYKEPGRHRPFRTPFVPIVPILGILSCILLMVGLPAVTWARFGAWLVAGLVIYWLYGYKKSALNRQRAGTP